MIRLDAPAGDGTSTSVSPPKSDEPATPAPPTTRAPAPTPEVVSALLLQRRVLLDQLDARIESDLRQEVDEVRQLAGGRDPATGEPFAADAGAILDTFLRRSIPSEGEELLALVPGRPPTATTAPYPLWEDADLVARWSDVTDTERGDVAGRETSPSTCVPAGPTSTAPRSS